MVNISNCPKTGLKRKVINRDLLVKNLTRQVILECLIGYFDANDVEISGTASGINRYTRNLVASNDKVNPQTGVALTQSQIDNNDPWVYEFDFFIAMKNVPIKINDYEVAEILASDQEGKFNI